MYGTDEYKEIKKQYEESVPQGNGSKNKCNKGSSDKKRSIILFQYLQHEFNLNEYSSLGETVILDTGTLEEIIKT